MKQHSIHTEMIKHVAEKLGPLRSKVVFLGGSATGFHIIDKDEFFLEALPGHLLPDQASQGRRSIILERIEKIIEIGSS
jgi:hypothetical protein